MVLCLSACFNAKEFSTCGNIGRQIQSRVNRVATPLNKISHPCSCLVCETRAEKHRYCRNCVPSVVPLNLDHVNFP